MVLLAFLTNAIDIMVPWLFAMLISRYLALVVTALSHACSRGGVLCPFGADMDFKYFALVCVEIDFPCGFPLLEVF